MLDHRYDGVRVSSVMPGSVDTEFSGNPGKPPQEDSSSWKVAASDVAEVVYVVLTMPQRTMVSRVEMRPSKPIK